MEQNKTIANSLDVEKLKDLMTSTENNVAVFDSITSDVVSKYADALDTVMKDIYQNVISVAGDIPNTVLESYYLNLTSTLYFMGDKAERVGIHADISKAASKEIYNKAYLENQIVDVTGKNKKTVNENTAYAEEASKYESVVNSIYERVYKQLKYKLDLGREMVNTLRKVISSRMQEQALNATIPSNATERKTLLEDI